jgi:hypothetical protein
VTAAFVVCSHTLAVAQGAPDLSRLDGTTRQSIELACITEKSNGPVAYWGCLNKQLDALRGSPGIPSLSGLDPTTRQSIELACITQKSDGPVAYGSCLNKQIDALRGSPGVPSLSDLDPSTRQSIELACITQKSDGPVAYGDCLRAQLHSIGAQPGPPAAPPTTRRTRGSTRGDALRVRASPPVSPASNSTFAAAPTDPSQAAPRKHRGAASFWQDPGSWALLFVAFLVFLYLVPIIWVLSSSRSRDGAKLGWFLVVLLFHWLGLAVFLIVTQAMRNRSNT